MVSPTCSNSTNYELYGRMTGVEQYAATGWFLIVFLSTVLGDILILVASIRYKALKLHDVIVVFIQHIAVCDLLMTVVLIFPQIVTVVVNCWVLGTVMCYVEVYGSRFGFPVSLYLICAMSITKLLLLRYPLKTRIISKKQGHMICSAIWIFASFYPITLLLVDSGDIYFDFRIYTCVYAYSDLEKWRFLKPLVLGILSILPTIIIIFTSVLLVKYLLEARKKSGRCKGNVRWKGIATVFLTAAVFIISSAPLTIYNLTESYFGKENVAFNVYFYRISYSFMYFAVAANCFIYYFTVPSFQDFVKTKIREIGWFYMKNKIRGKTAVIYVSKISQSYDFIIF